MTDTSIARLFRNGRSQAVRLPQAFRFPGDRVRIRRLGRGVLLELSAPIAQGLMSTGYLSQLLVDFFGLAWFESGWTSHAFIKPVSAGDTITVHGVLQESREEATGTRLVLEVWCRNQAGDLTTVGSASALVSR